jgi:hypothetical protein
VESVENIFSPTAFRRISLDEAFDAMRKSRANEGFLPETASLLTHQKAQPKFAKTPWDIIGLSLLPHSLYDEDVTNCPNSTIDCRKHCLNQQGRGKFDSAQRARRWRTDLFYWQPRAFYTILCHELEAFEREVGQGFLFRPNVYSDIRWERLLPDEWWEQFAHVRVMDYTKRWRRPEYPKPNYRLAYSASAHTKMSLFRDRIAGGANIAVVFDHPKDKAFPESWEGFRLVDGDEHDNLWERPEGVILGLRAKGSLKKSNSPFKRKLQ